MPLKNANNNTKMPKILIYKKYILIITLLFLNQKLASEEIFDNVAFGEPDFYSRVAAHGIISSANNIFENDESLLEHARKQAFLAYNYFWSVKGSRILRNKNFEVAIILHKEELIAKNQDISNIYLDPLVWKDKEKPNPNLNQGPDSKNNYLKSLDEFYKFINLN